ncbi:hypothetical protein Taro_018406 [Colocasia esculenta]|uniref:Uncharacterized protein n=1 Tax=Colocasia esculenta TaxID=4460 RepID=A0A843UTT1_COLES|nr:hypothetical protein [Colocasia esculenta]
MDTQKPFFRIARIFFCLPDRLARPANPKKSKACEMNEHINRIKGNGQIKSNDTCQCIIHPSLFLRVNRRQPHSSQFRAEEEEEVDLLGDLRLERAMPFTGGANLDDDVHFERLMLGPAARSQSMREAPAIASSQLRRKGSHTQSAAPSQATKGKAVATSQPAKGKGKDKGQAYGPAKGIVIRESPASAQKKKSWFS